MCILCSIRDKSNSFEFPAYQASQQGAIFGVATQHLLHLAADRRVYLMLILHLRVSSSDSSEVERLASILGDPRSIPPISKNIFVGNWAWFGLAILLSNSASSQNKAPCWEVCFTPCRTDTRNWKSRFWREIQLSSSISFFQYFLVFANWGVNHILDSRTLNICLKRWMSYSICEPDPRQPSLQKE